MSNTRNNTVKNAISRWLLATILLLSVFSFSGVATQPQSDQFTLKTTLVVSPNNECGRSINFKRASILPLSITTPAFNISRLHSLQIKTRLEQLSVCFANQPKVVRFYHVKTIPQNPGEVPVISLG